MLFVLFVFDFFLKQKRINFDLDFRSKMIRIQINEKQRFSPRPPRLLLGTEMGDPKHTWAYRDTPLHGNDVVVCIAIGFS